MKRKEHNTVKKIIYSSLIIVLLIFSILTFINLYKADICFEKAQGLVEEGMPDKALFYANCAVDRNTKEPNYYRGRAKVYVVLASEVETLAATPYKILAYQDLKTAYELNPNNLVTIRNSIPLYYYLAVRDYSLPGEATNVDESFLPITKEVFAINKENYSLDAGVISLIAKYEKRLGLEKEYLESVEIIRVLRPDLLDWHESFN